MMPGEVPGVFSAGGCRRGRGGEWTRSGPLRCRRIYADSGHPGRGRQVPGSLTVSGWRSRTRSIGFDRSSPISRQGQFSGQPVLRATMSPTEHPANGVPSRWPARPPCPGGVKNVSSPGHRLWNLAYPFVNLYGRRLIKLAPGRGDNESRFSGQGDNLP